MAYLGSTPTTSSQSLVKQDFSVSATQNYTLSHSVSSANDIALYINNVRQEPTYAYSASGTSLTLTAATAGSDDMYCIYLGRAVGTINPASGSVGLTQLSATGTKSSSTFLRGDNTFASISSTPNSPAFFAYLSANQTLTNNAYNKVNCNTEVFDSDGLYDNSSNYRFTPTTAGKYYCFANVSIITEGQSTCQWMLNVIFKNGTSGTRFAGYMDNRATLGNGGGVGIGVVIDFNGSSDYIELYTYPGLSSGTPSASSSATSRDVYFGAFKLGV